MKTNRKCFILYAVLALAVCLSACGRTSAPLPGSSVPAPSTDPGSQSGAEPPPEEASVPPIPEAAGPEARETPENPEEQAARDFLPDTEAQLADLINAERGGRGLQVLKPDTGLNGAARLRALEMAEGGYLAHRRPDGGAWYTVLEKEFPTPCTDKGENIAQLDGNEGREAGGAEWLYQIKLSPTQSDNILFPEFDRIGAGVYYTADGGGYRAVAVVLLAQSKEDA